MTHERRTSAPSVQEQDGHPNIACAQRRVLITTQFQHSGQQCRAVEAKTNRHRTLIDTRHIPTASYGHLLLELLDVAASRAVSNSVTRKTCHVPKPA
eukprot:417943-Prymnesium_polylepis.1